MRTDIVGALLLGGGGEKEADQWRIIGRNQTHRYNNINNNNNNNM